MATVDHYDWSWYDRHADRARRAWPETAAALPVGTKVTGRVIARMPFGIFVEIDGHPDALGLMETPNFPRGAELPTIGATVDGVVVDHVAHNWQLRLRPS
jgi:ribosomal protein S1